MRITHWAEVVKTWQIRDAAMLPRLEALTILDAAAIETRYRFRPDQAINVIAVRAYRLANPADVVMKPEYSGCRSWVSIDEEIDIDGSVAALSDDALDAQINAIDMLLAEPDSGVELTVVIIMLAAGVGLAASIIITFAAAQREADMSGATRAKAAPDRNHIAASLLFNLLVCGGTPPDVAMRAIRNECGPGRAGHVVDRHHQLERALREAGHARTAHVAARYRRPPVADRTTPVPLRQYSALLDLSFALGFQTDALAKLRDTYGFDYVDHAKDARPRSADRGGVSTPLYSRDQREPAELLRILGVEAPASRAVIIAAYRKLAAQHHPDKVFGESAEVQNAAAARFIEITRAYETLLAHLQRIDETLAPSPIGRV